MKARSKRIAGMRDKVVEAWMPRREKLEEGKGEGKGEREWDVTRVEERAGEGWSSGLNVVDTNTMSSARPEATSGLRPVWRFHTRVRL